MIHSIYKRVETDREFRIRLRKAGHEVGTLLYGKQLDDEAWQIAKMQRRIVEDES